MLTFGFAMMISVVKNPEGKKRDFCRFTITLKTVIFVYVQIQKVVFCKKALTFCIFWMSGQFEGHSTPCSQLTVKTMLARLRKLQSGLSLILRTAVTGVTGYGLVMTALVMF